jgi:hypothetical protein
MQQPLETNFPQVDAFQEDAESSKLLSRLAFGSPQYPSLENWYCRDFLWVSVPPVSHRHKKSPFSGASKSQNYHL